MSLLSSDRLVVAVHERGINVLHVRSGRLPRSPVSILSQQRLDMKGRASNETDGQGSEPPSWMRPMELLRDLGKSSGISRINLILSNHFVRYALLPWDRVVACNGETKDLASAHFQMAFGEAANTWQIAAEMPRFRSSCLAAAVDEQLLATAHEMAAANGLQLCGIRPYLISALQHWRTELQKRAMHNAGWFAVFEPGRLTVLSSAQNDTAAVYNIRLHASEALIPTLQQCVATDRLKSALDGPVCLHAPGWSGSNADLKPFLRLDGRDGSGKVPNGIPGMSDDYGQAMAWCGSV